MSISGMVIGTYLAVLIVLAVYGLHRTALISMYYRNKHRRPRPAGRFSELPVVTVQLPLFNEMYVVERLLDAVAGYAKTHYDFSFSSMTYDDDMFSFRVRLMYLY